MRPIMVTVGPPGAAGNIAAAQAATAQVALTLAAGAANISPAVQVQITSASGTDAGQFYIAGVDSFATSHGETVTMTAGAALTTAKFSVITRIVPLFQPAGNISAGTPTLPTTSSMVYTDSWADAPLGIQVVVSGTVSYTVQHSFDDPNDPISPVPLASMYWGTDLVPAGAIGSAAGISFSIATAPVYMRLLLSSGTGSARMTVSQYNTVEG